MIVGKILKDGMIVSLYNQSISILHAISFKPNVINPISNELTIFDGQILSMQKDNDEIP